MVRIRNIKLIVEYDGTAYHGWQSQINARAVQDEISKALKELTGEIVSVIGASRTDQGVHALGQVCNFRTLSRIPADKFCFALNAILPADISIKASEEVSDDFHSRFSAKGKKYKYMIYNSRQPSALLRHRAYHVPMSLDYAQMERASGYFIGTHDFSAFKAAGGSAKTSVRTVTLASLSHQGELMTFEIAGDGFLYNMVRIIAGTLVYVGLGKINADDIPDIIISGDRDRAGKTAPPQGLYLVEVYY